MVKKQGKGPDGPGKVKPTKGKKATKKPKRLRHKELDAIIKASNAEVRQRVSCSALQERPKI